MVEQSDKDLLENVAPGDIISLEFPDRHAGGGREYKVVHKDSAHSATTPTIIVTLEGDEGANFDVELPADSAVHRSLESKWESAQSPTSHQGS